ncbi:MAG: hypothetical protein ABIH71_00170 [Candidatus Omnitrophota bacterium]
MCKKFCSFAGLAVLLITMTGCMAYTTQLTKGRSVYHMTRIEGASKVILSDLSDLRPNKKSIGQVSALSLKSDVEINVALTDRIAAKLRDNGYNVEKINLATRPNKERIKNLLNDNTGILYISGGLSEFFISSFDAVMKPAKGNTNFFIAVYDADGNKLIEKRFTSETTNWIGLTGGFGADKSIDLALTASVNEVFKDKKIQEIFKITQI